MRARITNYQNYQNYETFVIRVVRYDILFIYSFFSFFFTQTLPWWIVSRSFSPETMAVNAAGDEEEGRGSKFFNAAEAVARKLKIIN